MLDGTGEVDIYNSELKYPNYDYDDALMGNESEYNIIASKLTDSSKLYIDAGKVYYRWDNLNNAPNVVGSSLADEWLYIETPTITQQTPTYGGLAYSTEKFAKADGVVSANMYNLSYEQKINEPYDL